MPIKLALVDDDLFIVELLEDYFNSLTGFSVVLTATSGNAFLTQLKTTTVSPEILLLDLRMKDGDGIHVIEKLRQNYLSVKIIVLSSLAQNHFIGYMLKLGVHALLPKQVEKEDLADIIKEVNTKGFYFSKEQLNTMRRQIVKKAPAPVTNSSEELSSGEKQVLELICRQYTAKEMAEKLCVSVKTIESRKSGLMLKLNVKNTAGLIIAAIQQKLVDADQVILLS